MEAIPHTTHRLFLEICEISLECDRRGFPDLASSILSKLFLAANKFDGIYDGRKRAVIGRVLDFFERQEDHDSASYLLTKLANLTDMTKSPLGTGLCKSLAKKLEVRSKVNRQALGAIWADTHGENGGPNLFVPPHLLASKECRENVVASLVDHLSALRDQPGLFQLRDLHIAAAMGDATTLEKVLSGQVKVDQLDEFHRTPLFLAAANGHADCCSQLLRKHAKPNVRDTHGHTAVEVAAKGGHLDVVQRLKDAGASIDPPLGLGAAGTVCTSTPLQAAFETTPTINRELVWYLLQAGADPWTRRGSDLKNAIDLAREKDEVVLFKNMTERPNPNLDLLNLPDFPDVGELT